MNFHFRNGWQVSFLEEDLRTPLPRRFVFTDDTKIIDLAKRGGADFSTAGRQAIELGLAAGRGGIWLHLTPKQYGKLKRV